VKFDFKRRNAEFGVFRNRREKDTDGKDTNKLKAIDLPVRFPIKPRELDLLVPTQGVALSQFLFGPDLRKPELQCPLLFPIKVYRRPEHLKISIYDDAIDKRKVMTFADCRVETPQIEYEDNVLYLSFKVEIHPGALLQRVADNVESRICDFECKATQPELFDEDRDEEEGEGDGQQSLMTNPDEEEEGDDNKDD
jgi:hypothetical protein